MATVTPYLRQIMDAIETRLEAIAAGSPPETGAPDANFTVGRAHLVEFFDAGLDEGVDTQVLMRQGEVAERNHTTHEVFIIDEVWLLGATLYKPAVSNPGEIEAYGLDRKTDVAYRLAQDVKNQLRADLTLGALVGFLEILEEDYETWADVEAWAMVLMRLQVIGWHVRARS